MDDDYEYICIKCEYYTNNRQYYYRHLDTLKHYNNYEEEIIAAMQYHCELCDYHTDEKSGYNRHIKTQKHKKNYPDETEEEYHCELCNYSTNNFIKLTEHRNTGSHLQKYFESIKNINNEYSCEKCDYYTNNKKGFYQHKKTKKHERNHKDENKKKELENEEKKYHCNLCNYHTNSQPSFSKHKKTEKHIKNKENIEEKEKISKKNKYGLIYVIRLKNKHYKIGMSKSCDLKRLKGYNGINKIDKVLLTLSIIDNKKFENILKENLNDYRYFEGITREYFKWNYKNNHKDNDDKLINIIDKEISYYLSNVK